MNRRTAATDALSWLRIVSLLERFASRPALVVLVYHRVLRPEAHPYDRDVIEVTPEQFDDQMAMLKRHHDVAVSLRYYVQTTESQVAETVARMSSSRLALGNEP